LLAGAEASRLVEEMTGIRRLGYENSNETTKRVLIYRLGSLGDTLVTLPVLNLVGRAFPNAEKRMLTNFPIHVKAPPAAAILEHTGLVDGYFRYTVGTRSPLALLALWWQLLRWRPQVLIYLSSARGTKAARRDALFFRLCGIKRQIGVAVTDDLQQNRLQADGVTLEYEAARLARTVAELGDARLDDAESWNLHLTDAERQRADEVLQPLEGRKFIAISLGTKVQANEWGPERWQQMLERVATLYPEYGLVVTGAPVDTEVSDFVAAGWWKGAASVQGGPAINLCGQTNPRESAAVFARAAVFIGHDSGPMHLAAAVQTPCVAIFSARGKPRMWFPYGRQHRVVYHRVECWGCNLDTCIVEQKRCIYSITVDEVIAKVRAALQAPVA
jgi:heptosyltransferase-3